MDYSTRMMTTMHKALHLRDDIDSTYQEKEDKEDLPKLMHQYGDSKTKSKIAKKDKLQLPVMVLTT